MSNLLSKKNFAYVVLLIAVIACAGVVYFDMHISDMERTYAQSQADQVRLSAQQDTASHVHTLLTQTLPQRQALDGLVNTDIVSIVDMIDKAGKAAGVEMLIQGTQQESAPPKAVKPIASTLAFSIQTTGTFAQVTKAIEMLSLMPIPSQVEQYDIELDNGTWIANIRVRIYTDATV